MTAQFIPSARVRVSNEDVSIDLLCFSHLMTVLGDRNAAAGIIGYVEAVLAANPGLAAHGDLLPLGIVVELPEFAIETRSNQVKRLWD